MRSGVSSEFGNKGNILRGTKGSVLIVAARCPVCGEPVRLNRSIYQNNYECPLRLPPMDLRVLVVLPRLLCCPRPNVLSVLACPGKGAGGRASLRWAQRIFFAGGYG